MGDSEKLSIPLRIILSLPIFACIILSVYTVYKYERCLQTPSACSAIVQREEAPDAELQRGKEILEEQKSELEEGV